MKNRDWIPREHGSWAILIVPQVSVWMASGVLSPEAFLFFLSSLALFMASAPIRNIVRYASGRGRFQIPSASMRQTAILLSFSALFAFPVVLKTGYLLPLFGAGGILLVVVTALLNRKGPRAVVSDMLASLGLTSTALGAAVAQSGTVSADAFAIWLCNLVFFEGTILYTHYKIGIRSAKTHPDSLFRRFRSASLLLAYHLFALACAGYYVWSHPVPTVLGIAFAPLSIHVVIGVARRTRVVSFKRLGFLLLGHSVLFGILLGVMFRNRI